jgi:cation diffusion facilitator CzcD-associated flavoprotein CzcO
VLRYLIHVAERFDLKRDITFNCRVVGAEYHEAANRWKVRTESGEELEAKFLITAVGCLSASNVPEIPGLSTFKGECYHTSQWPHEAVEFSGKRVGVIGTGSTGIQVVPEVAQACAHLTVFQRTANYSVPARNTQLTREQKRHYKENAAEIRSLMHASTNGHPYLISDRSALETPAVEREAIYEEAWAKGGLYIRPTFKDLLTSQEANDTARDFVIRKIRSVIKDPETSSKLSNIDHPYAAKRPPIDSGYFEAFNRPNVDLVDVSETPIQDVTADGIRTSGAHYPLDMVIFATGFDAMTGSLIRLNIRGKNGLALAKAWEAGPRTYLGLQVTGFPNLFTITGPGSPSVLCNVPVPIEQHVEWITDCIQYMRAKNINRIEPAPAAVDDWVDQVKATANATLLSGVKHSWYLGANVPGKPRVFMPYAGGMARYRKICAEVAANEYSGFVLS